VAELFNCPCCGRPSLDEEPPGTYIVRPGCGWQDDYVQFRDPEYRAGANRESLREARENYRRFGSASAPPWPPPAPRSELARTDDEESAPGVLRRDDGDVELL
jgi:hypothetical protein